MQTKSKHFQKAEEKKDPAFVYVRKFPSHHERYGLGRLDSQNVKVFESPTTSRLRDYRWDDYYTPQRSLFQTPDKDAIGSIQKVVGNPSFWLLIALIVMIYAMKDVFTSPAANSTLLSQSTIAQAKGVEYRSCDDRTSFSILNARECEICKPDLQIKCEYEALNERVPSFDTIFKGHLSSNELWYTLGPDRVCGADGVSLYDSTSPEFAVVKKMWWYADSAQNWFATHHMYPTSLDKWAKNENSFSFTNPFTKKHDQTILIALDKLTTDPSGIDRDKGCAVAPSWRPGGIYCVSLNDLKFVVHGFDRNGAPLTSTDADKYFVIECRNGINLTRQKLNDQASAKELKENVRTKVFVCSSSEQELLVRQIRVMSCICLWAGTIISALWCLIAFRLQQPKVVLVLSLLTTVGCSLLLISWYVLGYGMIPTGV